jgi:hypothetical protein
MRAEPWGKAGEVREFHNNFCNFIPQGKPTPERWSTESDKIKGLTFTMKQYILYFFHSNQRKLTFENLIL